MISVKKEKKNIEIVCRKSNIPTFQHFYIDLIYYKRFFCMHCIYRMYSVSYNNEYNKRLVNKIGKHQSQQTNDGIVNPYPEPIHIPPRYTLPQTKKQIINKREL